MAGQGDAGTPESDENGSREQLLDLFKGLPAYITEVHAENEHRARGLQLLEQISTAAGKIADCAERAVSLAERAAAALEEHAPAIERAAALASSPAARAAAKVAQKSMKPWAAPRPRGETRNT